MLSLIDSLSNVHAYGCVIVVLVIEKLTDSTKDA